MSNVPKVSCLLIQNHRFFRFDLPRTQPLVTKYGFSYQQLEESSIRLLSCHAASKRTSWTKLRHISPCPIHMGEIVIRKNGQARWLILSRWTVKFARFNRICMTPWGISVTRSERDNAFFGTTQYILIKTILMREMLKSRKWRISTSVADRVFAWLAVPRNDEAIRLALKLVRDFNVYLNDGLRNHNDNIYIVLAMVAKAMLGFPPVAPA